MVISFFFKMSSYFEKCPNAHRDVTDLINHEMVKNTKTGISWERNIIFLQNKKILNLCLRWHILRSYHFVAKVTFKSELMVCKIAKLCYGKSTRIFLECFSMQSLSGRKCLRIMHKFNFLRSYPRVRVTSNNFKWLIFETLETIHLKCYDS